MYDLRKCKRLLLLMLLLWLNPTAIISSPNLRQKDTCILSTYLQVIQLLEASLHLFVASRECTPASISRRSADTIYTPSWAVTEMDGCQLKSCIVLRMIVSRSISALTRLTTVWVGFNTQIYDGAELAETLDRYELPTHKVSTLRIGSQGKSADLLASD